MIMTSSSLRECGTNAPFSKHKDYHNSGMGVAGIAAVFFFSWAFSWSFGPGESHFEWMVR